MGNVRKFQTQSDIDTMQESKGQTVSSHFTCTVGFGKAVMSCGCILTAYKTSSLCQGCKNPRHQLAITTDFCTVVPNICGLSVCNLLHVILLAPRILRCLVHFWKICAPLHHTMKYPPPPILLLIWHYSPMWTFAYLTF